MAPVFVKAILTRVRIVDQREQRGRGGKEKNVAIEQKHAVGLQKGAEVENLERQIVRRAESASKRVLGEQRFDLPIRLRAPDQPSVGEGR